VSDEEEENILYVYSDEYGNLTFSREPFAFRVATEAEVDLDPAVAQRLAYWKWRQNHGHGEFDTEYESRY
jgi:hypothetical protein